ncbi:MAG: TIGR01906 family membrane protein, partial [Dehalococcoidia bacterium]|nr:TIGR01906 family membrane protein [Dehalococcoidia bacterium]
FNQREVLHMRDVKHLIWGVYVVSLATAVYILGFVGVGFFIYRRLFTAKLMGYLLWGGSLTLAFVVAVGLAALVGFDSLFLLFHQLSFSNDFWKLDPSRDYLVMMFPQGFWFDATLFVALVTVGQAVVLSGIAGSYMALQRRKPSAASQDVLPMQPPSEAAEV